ncbi:MAG: HD domain-containing protein [Candidatus Aminicenantes bacterium]|nr:HD domain-containing protein [Candidatus Aminicenantes bacterium]
MRGHRVFLYAEPGLGAQRIARLLKTLDVPVESRPVPEAGSRSEDGAGVKVVLAGSPDEAEKRFLRILRKTGPSGPLVLAVASPDPRSGLKLLRDGRADHVLGAEDLAGIYGAVRSAILGAGRLERIKVELNRYLRKARELEDVYEATVENLMAALDLRDVETFGHSQTVAKYSEVLASLLGIADPARRARIRLGALLHDIGKIAIPDSILKKPGPLTAEEWDKVKLHPTLGYGLIKEIKLVAEVGRIILFHHERFDGSGYPKGLGGSRIPFEARIFALADALEAITAHRPYRRARDYPAARTEILRHGGTQFDPAVVQAFASLPPEHWERIRFETTSRLPPLEEYSSLLRRIKHGAGP